MKPEIQAKLDQYLREKETGSLPSPVMAHGPGGLMSHSGMGERKRRRAEFLHTLVNKMKINQKKAIDLVNAVDKMRDVAVEKHLGGQHNQATHGSGGGSVGEVVKKGDVRVGQRVKSSFGGTFGRISKVTPESVTVEAGGGASRGKAFTFKHSEGKGYSRQGESLRYAEEGMLVIKSD